MISSKDSILPTITVALAGANLPPASLLKDRWFIFGKDDHFVIAQIKSIGYARSEGVKIYSTMERYRGIDVKCLKFMGSNHDGERWLVVPRTTDQTAEGYLLLLS